MANKWKVAYRICSVLLQITLVKTGDKWFLIPATEVTVKTHEYWILQRGKATV